MARPLVIYPDPRLRRRSDPVERFDGALRDLAAEMAETMREHRGVGLAGIQIGVPLRICVVEVDFDKQTSGEVLTLCNPEVTVSEGRQGGEEGCLSVPGVFEEVERSRKVTVRAWDLSGKERTFVFEDLLARCLEHEIDHMNGLLFLNRLSAVRRVLVEPKLKDLKRRSKADPHARRR